MDRSTLVLALTLLCGNVSAHAACEASPTVKDIALSAEKLLLRSGGYRELCEKAAGALIDGENTMLHGRLMVPGKAKYPPAASYGLGTLDPKDYGATVLVFIVEASGKVSWLSILDSSGSSVLDNMRASIYSRTTYREPATLDGKPVRIFMTQSVKLVSRSVISDRPRDGT
jgi:hypothetical protein